MHDDLGGGLTTIRFLSQKILKNTKDKKTKSQVEKVASYSEDLVNNMGEIIWAMNSGFDNLENLVSYLRRYCHEFIEDHPIDLFFKSRGDFKNVHLSGEYRRNIFLVVKEALHNVIKHSEASNVRVFINYQTSKLTISIIDNGIGVSEMKTNGNGLKNMEKRIEEIGGKFTLSIDKGTRIFFVLDLLKIENENNA